MKSLFIYIILLVPLLVLSTQVLILESVVEPVKYIYTFTGTIATIILFFSILISLIKNKINLIKHRKTIGLFGFFYALLHLMNFVIFDAQFDLLFIYEETIDKPFIYLGMIAIFILLFMTITSTKKLYKQYNKYHKLVYLSLVLITIHFIMAQKALSILQMSYIGVMIVISFLKLNQFIIKNNKN